MRRVSGKGSCVKEDFTVFHAVVPMLCVSFLLCVIFSVSHLAHFHLTRLFACLVTSVFPISLQAFMDSQV